MITINQAKSRLARVENRYMKAFHILKAIASNIDAPITKRFKCLKTCLQIQDYLEWERTSFYAKD